MSVNIHNDENKEKLAQLASLPDSCAASAKALEDDREIFERYGVFAPAMLDGIIRKLNSFNDKNLRAEIGTDRKEMLNLVNKYWHC